VGREASEQQILRRLSVDAPAIYRIARREFAAHTRSNLFRFLGAAFTSPERYRALLESRDWFDSVLEVLAASDFLTDLLVRYPEEVATIAGIRDTRSATGPYLVTMSPDERDRSPFVDFVERLKATRDEKLALVRRQFRTRVFASGARDVLQRRDVFDSLAETSDIAIESIHAAISLCDWPEGLAVFALGRLGSCEFDILSDADLVFVRAEALDVGGATTAATHLMQSLSAYTRDGTLFPVDARLRPRGNDGELVVISRELLRYFETEAQPWEALTWTKLRLVHGWRTLHDEVVSARQCLLTRFAADHELTASLLYMREQLERSDDPASLRTGAGGVYDIDFIVGTLLVLNGGLACQIGTRSLGGRLQFLAAHGVLSQDDSRALIGAADLLRSVEHAIRLATGVSRKTLPASGHARDAVEALVRSSALTMACDLESTLACVRSEVRGIFERVMATARNCAKRHTIL
jgi:glutamate-ammonia-ligase adenylyltransferase